MALGPGLLASAHGLGPLRLTRVGVARGALDVDEGAGGRDALVAAVLGATQRDPTLRKQI